MHQNAANRVRSQATRLVSPTVYTFGDANRLRLLPLIGKLGRIMEHEYKTIGSRLCDRESIGSDQPECPPRRPWQTSGMLCPMALPICESSLRNLSRSRASLNSHPAISRSTHPCALQAGREVLPADRSLNSKPMEHPLRFRIRCSAMNHKRFFRFKIFAFPPRPKMPELWVIKSFTGRVRLSARPFRRRSRQHACAALVS
jgi:hypothetical protein